MDAPTVSFMATGIGLMVSGCLTDLYSVTLRLATPTGYWLAIKLRVVLD